MDFENYLTNRKRKRKIHKRSAGGHVQKKNTGTEDSAVGALEFHASLPKLIHSKHLQSPLGEDLPANLLRHCLGGAILFHRVLRGSVCTMSDNNQHMRR